MTKSEAKRFAHRLVADMVDDYVTHILQRPPELVQSPDWPRIEDALHLIQEQHARYGPKILDKEPRPPRYLGEPLPYDGTIDLLVKG